MTNYALPANCNREAALSLLAFLTEAADGKVSIDAASVEKIGQPMLQVLLAARAGGTDVVVSKPSPALREAAALVAVENHLLAEQAA